jgi:hypothetical protein
MRRAAAGWPTLSSHTTMMPGLIPSSSRGQPESPDHPVDEDIVMPGVAKLMRQHGAGVGGGELVQKVVRDQQSVMSKADHLPGAGMRFLE